MSGIASCSVRKCLQVAQYACLEADFLRDSVLVEHILLQKYGAKKRNWHCSSRCRSKSNSNLLDSYRFGRLQSRSWGPQGSMHCRWGSGLRSSNSSRRAWVEVLQLPSPRFWFYFYSSHYSPNRETLDLDDLEGNGIDESSPRFG